MMSSSSPTQRLQALVDTAAKLHQCSGKGHQNQLGQPLIETAVARVTQQDHHDHALECQSKPGLPDVEQIR